MEANMDQAGLVKAILDDFCAASREKVNASKSRIFILPMFMLEDRKLAIFWDFSYLPIWVNILEYLLTIRELLKLPIRLF